MAGDAIAACRSPGFRQSSSVRSRKVQWLHVRPLCGPGRLRRFFVLRFNEVSSPNFFTASHRDAHRIVSHGYWSLSNFRGADYLPAFKRLMDARRTTTWTNWQRVIPGSINMQKSLKLLQPAFDQEKL
jgi:hypothetical protein